MKIYRVTYYVPDQGMCLRWEASQDAASKAKTELCVFLGIKRASVQIAPVDIDTTKPGLLAWLNSNVTRDNG